MFVSGSIVKAGGKRMAKKSFDDSGSHGIPDKETKRTDKPRLAGNLHLLNCNKWCQLKGILPHTVISFDLVDN